MARTDKRYRAAHNNMIELFGQIETGSLLPSEPKLAERLRVSRTTIRAILHNLERDGLVHLHGREKTLLRAPIASDRIDELPETMTMEELQGRFLEWVLRFDVPPNTPLNVAQLAKQFSVPSHSLQAFLSHLSGFGLVERRPRGGWLMLGFTLDYALELSEFRMLLEMNAIETFISRPDHDPVWSRLEDIESAHLSLLARIERDFHDFSKLDEDFHTTINSVVTNRFVTGFQKVISLIFHYHYQWDKREELTRNRNAIGEHLRIITALKARNRNEAQTAARAHLATSKETLAASMIGNNLAA